VLVDGWQLVVGSLMTSFVTPGSPAERRDGVGWPAGTLKRGSQRSPIPRHSQLTQLKNRDSRRHPPMPYDESILEIVRQTLIVTLKIAAPMLVAGIVIGLVISIMQSITSIQDQALSLVPKIVGMIVVAALLLPWIAQRLLDFSSEMFLLF
jgi:flagellar biosynthetic protein FliQ